MPSGSMEGSGNVVPVTQPAALPVPKPGDHKSLNEAMHSATICATRRILVDRLHSVRFDQKQVYEHLQEHFEAIKADLERCRKTYGDIWDGQDADIETVCDAFKWYSAQASLPPGVQDQAKDLCDQWSSRLPTGLAAAMRDESGTYDACSFWIEAERRWPQDPRADSVLKRFARTKEAQHSWSSISSTVEQRRGAVRELLQDHGIVKDCVIWVEEPKTEGGKTKLQGCWKPAASFLSGSTPEAQGSQEKQTRLVENAVELAVFSEHGELLLCIPLHEAGVAVNTTEAHGLYLRRKPAGSSSEAPYPAVSLGSSRSDYANRAPGDSGSDSELTAEQQKTEKSFKVLHRKHLAKAAKNRKLGERGCAVFLEAQDAPFTLMLLRKKTFKLEQMYIPNPDPFVCCRILCKACDDTSPDAAPHLFCTTLGECLSTLAQRKEQVSFMWADYCGTVENYPQNDLPFFFEKRLPAQDCVLAVTYSYRGGKAYKNDICGDKKEGERYGKASVEQTARNVSQTFGFTSGTMYVTPNAYSARSKVYPKLRPSRRYQLREIELTESAAPGTTKERLARRLYVGIGGHQMFFMPFSVHSKIGSDPRSVLEHMVAEHGREKMEELLHSIRESPLLPGPCSVLRAATDETVRIDGHMLELLLTAALKDQMRPLEASVFKTILSANTLPLSEAHLDESYKPLPSAPCLRALSHADWNAFVARSTDPQSFKPLGVLTFEFKNKAGTKGKAGTVEREYWFQDVSEDVQPDKRFVVLHLHFAGMAEEYERYKLLGRADAANPALGKVTSLNVRHGMLAKELAECANRENFQQDHVCRRLFVAKEKLKLNPYLGGFPPHPGQRAPAREWDQPKDAWKDHHGQQGQIPCLANAVDAATAATDINQHLKLPAVLRALGDCEKPFDPSLKPFVRLLLDQADQALNPDRSADTFEALVSTQQLDGLLTGGGHGSSAPPAAQPVPGSALPEARDVALWQQAAVAIGVKTGDNVQLKGSGFVIDVCTGVICTCEHVLRKMEAIAGARLHEVLTIGIGSPIQWKFRAAPLFRSPHDGGMDLAVLRVIDPLDLGAQQHPAWLRALPLGDSDDVGSCDQIQKLGYGQADTSRGLTAFPVRGNLSGREDCWLKTDLTVLAGDSGGPVLDCNGMVIGWCISSEMDQVRGGFGKVAAGCNLLRPINDLKRALLCHPLSESLHAVDCPGEDIVGGQRDGIIPAVRRIPKESATAAAVAAATAAAAQMMRQQSAEYAEREVARKRKDLEEAEQAAQEKRQRANQGMNAPTQEPHAFAMPFSEAGPSGVGSLPPATSSTLAGAQSIAEPQDNKRQKADADTQKRKEADEAEEHARQKRQAVEQAVQPGVQQGAASSSAQRERPSAEQQGADAKRPRPNESTMAPGPKWHLFLSHSAPRQASNPRTPHSHHNFPLHVQPNATATQRRSRRCCTTRWRKRATSAGST